MNQPAIKESICDGYDSTIPDELLDPWLEALRSGKFAQTKYRLHRLAERKNMDGEIVPVGYCCLGVVCEINRDQFANIRESLAGDSVIFDGSDGLLPDVLREKLGMDGYGSLGFSILVRGEYYENVSLAGLNDGLNFTFSQIADMLEYFKRERKS